MNGVPTASPIVPERTHDLPDEVYARMTLLLRAGLSLALAFLVIADIAYLIQNPSQSFAGVIGSNPILPYLSAEGLSRGIASGQAAAYLTIGLFVLIATPVARVAAGAYYFHKNREPTLTRVTVAVVILLLVGLFVLGPLIH